MIRAALVAALLALAGCNGIDTGLNPGPDVRKEQGPLVRPPPGMLPPRAQAPQQASRPACSAGGDARGIAAGFFAFFQDRPECF